MKNQPRLNKYFLTLLFTLSTACGFAQQTFKYRAALPKIDSDSFYRVILQPSFIAKCQADLSDIRIQDQNGKPVPYIFGDQLPVRDQRDFIALPAVGTVINTDTSTIFRIENTSHYAINQLFVKLRNTAVQRSVNLSGSDDLKQWYAIDENIPLTQAGNSNNGVYEQMLNFPSSTYKYFKLTINHKNQETVEILQAGIYKRALVAPAYTQIPGISFTQKDSDKISHVIIKLNEPYQVNKLYFDIAGSKYYKRQIAIYQINGTQRSLISESEISSTYLPGFILSVKARTLELEIMNDDNPALVIQGVKAYQLDQSLICYLEKAKQYHLLLGDSTALAPQYDLKAFTDSLHQQLPVIDHEAITANSAHQTQQIKATAGIPKWIIWAAIVFVVGILALLTFKMTAEVNKKGA
jgi:hypothetical protein